LTVHNDALLLLIFSAQLVSIML